MYKIGKFFLVFRQNLPGIALGVVNNLCQGRWFVEIEIGNNFFYRFDAYFR